PRSRPEVPAPRTSSGSSHRALPSGPSPASPRPSCPQRSPSGPPRRKTPRSERIPGSRAHRPLRDRGSKRLHQEEEPRKTRKEIPDHARPRPYLTSFSPFVYLMFFVVPSPDSSVRGPLDDTIPHHTRIDTDRRPRRGDRRGRGSGPRGQPRA